MRMFHFEVLSSLRSHETQERTKSIQIRELSVILGGEQMEMLQNCSHNLLLMENKHRNLSKSLLQKF